MIQQMADFYRFLFNLDFFEFCEILQKPHNDSWAIEKFQLMTRDFGKFICDNENIAECLYDYYIGCLNIKEFYKYAKEADHPFYLDD